MAIMYLPKENFTCPTVQISLYLSVLKQFTLSKTVWNHADIISLVNSVDPDQVASKEACWSGNNLFYLLNDYLVTFWLAWYRVICIFYTVTLPFFWSVHTSILKVDMISLNSRPFSFFQMMGVFSPYLGPIWISYTRLYESNMRFPTMWYVWPA